MNFLGIYREAEYSPGRHTSNDAMILRLVGQALERLDVKLTLTSLKEARALRKKADLIFSMCQGPAALEELKTWHSEGARIFNNPTASLGTYRETLCRKMKQEKIPFPASALLATDGSENLKSYDSFFKPDGAWLKRSNVHATRPEDVVRVQTPEELGQALTRFRERNLDSAILQKNIAGDEVKFYAVQGGRFFWPFYPKDCIGHPFDENQLKRIAEDAARLLNINVYGGDAIISADGTITLIDLNDWPSFAPCRGAAAHAIARFLKESYVTPNRRTTTVSA
jgi:glutathione synthase/RimK-type ligase-like ATP-grasp enzyme